MSYHIAHINYYLPAQVITNKYLAEECGIDPNFLENKIGIRERRIADKHEYTSDMAAKCARQLLEEARVAADDIDALILCTENPDYRLPHTSAIIHNVLGLKQACLAFDVNHGCSGFVYTLVIAGSLIQAKLIKTALIIMADEYSKIIDYKDKNTASLFGDAASAAIIQSCHSPYGFVDADFGMDSKGYHHLILHNSGVALDASRSNFLYMNGWEIYKFVINNIPLSINRILERNKLSVQDVRCFILHQANEYMLREIQHKINIPDEKMVIDMQYYGNTVSSSILIGYRNIMARKELKNGDLIVFCGFGVGLSWATMLYRHYTESK